jgi:hypothetical protein
LFGVSRIKIDPQGQTTETNPTGRGPQITIEEEFANNLSLSYSTNVSQAAQQIIQVEYNVTRNVSIVGIRDQDSGEEAIQCLVFGQRAPREFGARPQLADDVHGDHEDVPRLERLDQIERGPGAAPPMLAEQVDEK